jgi:hypothetical protein
MVERTMSRPTGYTIQGTNHLELLPSTMLDQDPRGICWMFEEPNPRATYVMGIDPTVGITNWDRTLRTEDDTKTDNGAIEIIKVGRMGKPDVQVCEYAAPIDPEDLADVANVLGRLYSGQSDDEQCLCIIEVYPGPGLLTLRKMINAHGYTNHFVWKYLDSMTTKPTNVLGWTASPKSVRDLWIRGSRHINRGGIIIRSDYFVEEMTDCVQDPIKMAAKAAYGAHDDRMRALLMAVWAAHDWNSQIETDSHSRVEVGSVPTNWQQSDISSDRMFEQWEERFSEIAEDPY